MAIPRRAGSGNPARRVSDNALLPGRRVDRSGIPSRARSGIRLIHRRSVVPFRYDRITQYGYSDSATGSASGFRRSHRGPAVPPTGALRDGEIDRPPGIAIGA
jgi:hypothetical protein